MSVQDVPKKGHRRRRTLTGTDYTPSRLNDTYLKILHIMLTESKRWTSRNLTFRVNTLRRDEGKRNLSFNSISRAVSQLNGLGLVEAHPRQQLEILDEETKVFKFTNEPTYRITEAGVRALQLGETWKPERRNESL